MATVYDVDASELIKNIAEELKKIDAIKPPVWAPFVKTGVHKERPPVDRDWWYVRVASVLRKVYVLGPIGVSKLRRKYGGKRNQGHNTEHFDRGSGNIIRKALQQLQKAELIMYIERKVHKGRIIAPKGVSLLHKIATEIYTRISKPLSVSSSSTGEAKPEEKTEKIEKSVKAEKTETKKKESKPKKERKEPKKKLTEDMPKNE